MEQTIEPAVELKVKKKVKAAPAGFWIRLGATVIDGIILAIVQAPISILNGVLGAMVGGKPGQEPNPEMAMLVLLTTFIGMFVSIAVTVCYVGFFYSKKGATPGKMVFGLKVVSTETGKNLTFWKAGLRDTVGKGISSIILAIGYLMAAFRDDKKALHDIMFNSQVIKVKN